MTKILMSATRRAPFKTHTLQHDPPAFWCTFAQYAGSCVRGVGPEY